MTVSGKIPILQVGAMPPTAEALLAASFELTAFAGETEVLAAASSLGGVRGIATSGKATIGAELIRALPDLRVISCLGAGFDGIDVSAAQARGVEIATTSRVLASDVADVAMGLVIATARDFVGADRFVREGGWAQGRYPLGRSLGGAKLGVVGLGNIGKAVARRASAFDMQVAYTARRQDEGAPWAYFADLAELARWSRFLVVCCPGGRETYRLINENILSALGTDGILINVARGSVVDEAALAQAIEAGTIAGAGLDVFEDEPKPHPALLASRRVTVLPHIGSATVETRERMAQAMVDALASSLELD
ncbi:2-hydroxyacid dehydrogenase [Mesorhizobium sp. ASY16-5R]|uniref:2-hydroxyacid dehydrogenase n=1 Tax=Mesorhizobium sp. ASY16-5R TaxID=3445772 RepID=UPI003F9F851A